MSYEVRTEVFEGPFDLLLHLIARQEVDLYEVSLTGIVDAYLAELDRMGPLDLEMATEFLVIAATLVELKTRRLLPEPVGDGLDADDLALFEQRDLLLARLLECRTFAQAGGSLGRLLEAGARSAPRTAGPGPSFLALAPDLLAGVTPDDLGRALVKAASPQPPPRVDLRHVAANRISVGEALAELLATIPAAGATTFRELTAGIDGRIDLVVRFLAVLELYKQGLVELDQASTFGELRITWSGGDESRPVGPAGRMTGADSYGS
ncbi:MAG TPA: ScpA family protein [Acidimicrobiales bacterium]|nr:ScpA family protein [Acidimicrobiales bacterium]